MKAKPLDRLKLTRDKSPLLESKYASFDESLEMAYNDAVAAPSAEILDILRQEGTKPEVLTSKKHEYNKETSPFLQARQHSENPTCPNCGSEMERWESCWRCPKCLTSLC